MHVTHKLFAGTCAPSDYHDAQARACAYRLPLGHPARPAPAGRDVPDPTAGRGGGRLSCQRLDALWGQPQYLRGIALWQRGWFATVPVWVPPAVLAVAGKMGRLEPDGGGGLRA